MIQPLPEDIATLGVIPLNVFAWVYWMHNITRAVYLRGRIDALGEHIEEVNAIKARVYRHLEETEQRWTELK